MNEHNRNYPPAKRAVFSAASAERLRQASRLGSVPAPPKRPPLVQTAAGSSTSKSTDFLDIQQRLLERERKKGVREIALSVRLPRLPSRATIWAFVLRMGRQLRRIPRRAWQASAGLALVALGIVALTGVLKHPAAVGSQRPVPASSEAANRPADSAQEPSYATLLPAGKTIASLGGWRRVSPPDKEAVFGFADHIGSVAVTVSQQPLPASFKPNATAALAGLAQQAAATEKVAGATAYVATAKTGQQSLFAVQHDLLVLITSSAGIATQDWAAYLNNLQ